MVPLLPLPAQILIREQRALVLLRSRGQGVDELLAERVEFNSRAPNREPERNLPDVAAVSVRDDDGAPPSPP